MRIGTPAGEAEWAAYYRLRWEILRKPLGLGEETARDEREEGAYHLAAYEDGSVVGVGRLHRLDAEAGQIRYMAVDPSCRGRGIGRRILEGLVAEARVAGYRRVVLNARQPVVDFYRKAGFTEPPDPFFEYRGIPHVRMFLELG